MCYWYAHLVSNPGNGIIRGRHDDMEFAGFKCLLSHEGGAIKELVVRI